MNLFKNWSKLKTLTLVLIGFAVIVAIYGVYAYYEKIPEPVTVRYSGNNSSFSISFTRFTDYDTFLKAKSSNIIIYDTKEEMRDPPGSGYIAGEVEFNGTRDFDSCDVELIREIKWNTTTVAMNMEPGKKGPISLPFTSSDFPDSAKNTYKTAIIRFEDKEVVIPLRAIN